MLLLLAGAVFAALPEVVQQKAWRGTVKKANTKVIPAVPKFQSDKMIVSGNKKLTFENDGTITVSNSSYVLATIIPFSAYNDKHTNKTDWVFVSGKDCKVRRDGNRIVWELFKTKRGKTVKVVDQTLEILDDGIIRMTSKFYKLNDENLERRQNCSIFLATPIEGNEGRKVVFNGKAGIVSNKLKFSGYRENEFKYEVYPDIPADTFTVKCVKPQTKSVSIFPVGKKLRFVCAPSKEEVAVIDIDLRKSGIEDIDAANTRAGVDFMRTEKLEMPYISPTNLIFNSSFEQNMIGWKVHNGLVGHYDNDEKKWNSNPFQISAGGFNGKHALQFNARFTTSVEDYRHISKGVNITSPAVMLEQGTYTLSFYAKVIASSQKNCYFNAWTHNFNAGAHTTMFLPQHASGHKTFKLSRQWKRYTMTFVMPKAGATAVSFNVNAKAKVLFDAVQLEKGTKATAYVNPPAEGLLMTSAEDNFVEAGKKIDARVRIFTGKAVSGKVSVRVKNIFDEIVYKGTHSFKTDKTGYATVALPLEKVGKGLFTVRFDYALADGRKSYNHTRFTVMDFLNNTHRLKNLFSEAYYLLEKHHLFIKMLDRSRKIGIGSKTHMFNREKKIWDKYREYGVEPLSAFLVTNLWAPGTTKVTNFGIKYSKDINNYTTDKSIIIGDHNLSNNGEFDEAYLKKFADAAAEVARRYPHIKCWAMQGEVRAKYDNSWWSKEGTEEEASRRHALYLKAVVEGIKRGNPEAKIFQDDPCNMRPEGGIAETAALLEECNKQGVRFDLIAIHPYRFSPESPDLDADAQLLFKTIKEKGYGDDVKVSWPEMMHWGPFNIPQWGTISSTWGNVPRTWAGWSVSYDIGATEKLSAAWRARSWLVALKYSDRIVTATSGGTNNNFHMDEELTPYLSSLMPNVLGHLLGDSKFQKDIRFAPFCRAYVFTDQDNRPVVAVWCHLDKMDNGYTDCPIAEADFGDSLESVIDIMNNKRAFTKGKFKFPVGGFPLFLRGKAGTLDKVIKAMEKAEIISGDGISPLEVTCNPASAKSVKVNFKNLLSRDFAGSFNGHKVVVPASGTASVTLPVAKPLTANKVTSIKIPAVFNAKGGQHFDYDLSFEALTAKRISDDNNFDNINWDKLPKVKFTRNMRKKETSGNYSIGWNRHGIFIQIKVNDKKFIHTEFKETGKRWKNDCVQIYFDTMANGRFRQFKGYDEDDYDYALFPNSKGNGSIVWRNRSVEQQLGLATQAPKDQTVADDIPSSFSKKDGVLTYRVFFPAKYLLPVKLRAGWVMGFGLYVPNVDVRNGVVTSALTLANNGMACFNAPHTYPALLLVD